MHIIYFHYQNRDSDRVVLWQREVRGYLQIGGGGKKNNMKRIYVRKNNKTGERQLFDAIRRRTFSSIR